MLQVASSRGRRPISANLALRKPLDLVASSSKDDRTLSCSCRAGRYTRLLARVARGGKCNHQTVLTTLNWLLVVVVHCTVSRSPCRVADAHSPALSRTPRQLQPHPAPLGAARRRCCRPFHHSTPRPPNLLPTSQPRRLLPICAGARCARAAVLPVCDNLLHGVASATSAEKLRSSALLPPTPTPIPRPGSPRRRARGTRRRAALGPQRTWGGAAAAAPGPAAAG